MGFFRFVKKSVLVLGFCASIAYMGDRTNFNDRFVNPIMYANRPVASQFYNPLEVQKKVVINDNGKLETYLVSNGVEVPVLQGTQGPVLPIDYELRNLSQAERYSVVVQSWDDLSQEQKYTIASNEVESILGERYQELEGVLKDFFTIQGGGD